MKTIFDPALRAKIEHRLKLLSPSSTPKWGKLTAGKMLPHCTDQIWLGLGKKKGEDHSSLIRRTIAKWFVIYGTGFPKTGVKTIPEMDWEVSGTQATAFEQDRKTLLNAIQDFCNRDARKGFEAHPYFGRLTRDQWGVLVYKHLDHHLFQFGC